MRKLLTTAAVAGLAAGALVAPQAAGAAGPPAPLADQLILCNGNPGIPLNVTVENLTYDSTGPVPFNLTAGGCQKIVDGNPGTRDDPSGTPISATYRVASEPDTKNGETLTVLTTTSPSGSAATRTVVTEANVSISALEGVEVTFTPGG